MIVNFEKPKYKINSIVIKNRWSEIQSVMLIEDKQDALDTFESYAQNIKNKVGAWDGSEEVELKVKEVY